MDIDTFDFELVTKEDLLKYGQVKSAASILSLNARDRDTDPRQEIISRESIKVKAAHNIVHPTAPFLKYMFEAKDQIRAHNSQFAEVSENSMHPVPRPNHLNLSRPLGLTDGGIGEVLTMSFQPTTSQDEVRVAKTSIMKGVITALRALLYPGIKVLVFGAGDGYPDVNRIFKSVRSFDLTVDLYEPGSHPIHSYADARYVKYGGLSGHVAGRDIFSRDEFMSIPIKTYDVVVAINSLHFALASDEAAVRQLYSILKQGGKLVGMYPDRVGIQAIGLGPPGRHHDNITLLGLSNPRHNVPHHAVKVFDTVVNEPSYIARTMEMSLASCGFNAVVMHNSAAKDFFRETNFMQKMRDTYDKRAYNVVIADPDMSYDTYEGISAAFDMGPRKGVPLPFGDGCDEFHRGDEPRFFGFTLSKGRPVNKKDLPYLAVEDWLISPKIDGVPSYGWFQDGMFRTSYGAVLLGDSFMKHHWRHVCSSLLQVELVFKEETVDVFLTSVLSLDGDKPCSIGHGLVFGSPHLPEFIHLKGWDHKTATLAVTTSVFGCPCDGWAFDSYSSMSRIVPVPEVYNDAPASPAAACTARALGYTRYIKFAYTVDLEVYGNSFVVVPDVLKDIGFVPEHRDLTPGVHEFALDDGYYVRSRPDRLTPNSPDQIIEMMGAIGPDVVERQLAVNGCREILPPVSGISQYLVDPLDKMKFDHKLALAVSFPRPLRVRTQLGVATMGEILAFRRKMYDAVRRGCYSTDLSKLYADLHSGKLDIDDCGPASCGQFIRNGLPGAPNYSTPPVTVVEDYSLNLFEREAADQFRRIGFDVPGD